MTRNLAPRKAGSQSRPITFSISATGRKDMHPVIAAALRGV